MAVIRGSAPLRGLVDLIRADAWLALRYLGRQRRRTLFGLLSIAFGVAALMFATGFIEFLFLKMREETVRSRLGHFQVARLGFFDSGRSDPFRFVLPAAASERAALERIDGVAAVGARIEFSGLISIGDTTVSFIGEGIEPDKEAALTEGVVISSGANLDPLKVNEVIVGDGLAATLGTRVGDPLVLLVNTPGGGVNAVEVRVRGLFSTATKAFDDFAIRTHLKLAQQLLRLDGAHLWVVALTDSGRTAQVEPALRAALDPRRFEVRTWMELADFYNKTVSLFSRQVGVLKFIIALLIVLVVSNTVSMNVLERTAEIGTSLAVGVPRSRILRQFLIEGTLLGLLGGVAGALAGAAVAVAATHVGIPMPPPPGLGRGFTAGVLVTPALTLGAVALAVGAACVASILPALKVTRVVIVDALRHAR